MKHTPSARTWWGESCAAEQDRWEREGLRISLADLTGERLVRDVPTSQRGAALTAREREMHGAETNTLADEERPFWHHPVFHALCWLTAAVVVWKCAECVVRGVMTHEWRCP